MVTGLGTAAKKATPKACRVLSSFNCLISGVEPHVSALSLAQNALIIEYPAFNDNVPGDEVFPTFPFMSLSAPDTTKSKRPKRFEMLKHDPNFLAQIKSVKCCKSKI